MCPHDALLCVLVVLVAWALACWLPRVCAQKEGLVVSPKARKITQEARDVFRASRGAPRYRDYKRAVTDADPVQFDVLDALHRAGQLQPEEVQKMLNRG